ncbi:MAG: MoxR family ATPase [Bacteroidetes bacterium]|nr:MoxR family ATPase [Bacteroidota bacterium]MBS1540600.1 MoxR family ATPase [Bacteroidota bacterium]
MEENTFQSRIDLGLLTEQVNTIKKEIGKVIVGQEQMVELLITAILADGHVLIEGVPGVAKTLSAKLLSKIISVDFSRIQFTPDLMPSDVVGTSVYNLKTSEFEFKAGPIFSNLILIDEINRAPAKTQAALFEVMEERQVTVDGKTHKMKSPYLVVATQNPIEQEGTYRLPEAQLDRFLFKIVVDYPTLDNEVEILTKHQQRNGAQPLTDVNAVLSAEQVQSLRQALHAVHVEANLIRYVAQLVNETRNNPMLFLGASPRASLAILVSAKAHALIHGRDFVSPDDIKVVSLPVLRHRVVLSPEKEMEGISADDVIKLIINKVEVPR